MEELKREGRGYYNKECICVKLTKFKIIFKKDQAAMIC